MTTPANNQTQTPENPVEGVLPAVLQCLLDWQREVPTNLKGHEILRALALETQKVVRTPDQELRRFTAKEIQQAYFEFSAKIKPLETKDPNKWLDWKNTVERYWDARKKQVMDFARARGLSHYPELRRNSTPGGPGNETTYQIIALPLQDDPSEVIVDDEASQHDQAKSIISYDRTPPGHVRPVWWARVLFTNGEIRIGSWQSWVIGGFVFLIFIGVIFLAWASYVSLLQPRPLTTAGLGALVTMGVIPLLAWIFVIRPFWRLVDDRIVQAPDMMTAFSELPAQLELFRDGQIRVARLVRYSALCPVCGATIYLDSGNPDFPRRMVGRCAESPREHIFSFDRVTWRGRVLRNPPV